MLLHFLPRLPGAAADLRIGINYQPNMYLLDMRYAPPQKYIMNKYTPRYVRTLVSLAIASPFEWMWGSSVRPC